jgi:hypothetical protein
MPDLTFTAKSISVVHYAAAPTLGLNLLVSNADPEEVIHSVALRCQIQIEVTRRNYTAQEKRNLADLFGEPSRWGQTLRPMLWTHVQTVVRSFQESTLIELQVPCTFDFNVASTKYFHGLESGEIPVCLMFSGTVYKTDEEGSLQVSPIPWDKEARFRIPVAVWREMMELYYPNTAWLCLRRDVFERLYKFKVERGIPTWELAFETMLNELAEAKAVVS